MKYLITGASGTIGTEIIKQLEKNYPDIEYIPVGRKEMDIENKQETEEVIALHKPDVVIHLAAYTDVDRCEELKEDCYKTNVKGTENICAAVKKIDAILVFPSTFYIYSGGDNKVFDERKDEPDFSKVIGYYSKTKLLGEMAIKKSGIKKFFIFRIGSLFGGGKKDKKFVMKILKLAKSEKEIKLVNDRLIQPTYVKDAAFTILKVIQTDNYNVYNLVGQGNATYYDYGKAILEYADFKDVKLTPIDSSEFKESAPRAPNLTAINGRLQDLKMDYMRDWHEALKDYIQNELIKEKII